MNPAVRVPSLVPSLCLVTRLFAACGLALAMFLSTRFTQAAEISTNGIGGGAWSDPATWRGKAVPGPADDVTILKFDEVTFDRNDDGKVTCRKLRIDPKGLFIFKTSAGK